MIGTAPRPEWLRAVDPTLWQTPSTRRRPAPDFLCDVQSPGIGPGTNFPISKIRAILITIEKSNHPHLAQTAFVTHAKTPHRHPRRPQRRRKGDRDEIPSARALGIGVLVNADIIAAGLSGFAPESVAFEAGRIVLKRIHTLFEQKVSFAFETTLSSKTFVKLLTGAKKGGFEIDLIYLALPNVSTAMQRVAVRVSQGVTVFRST
jgi:Zeta toxin